MPLQIFPSFTTKWSNCWRIFPFITVLAENVANLLTVEAGQDVMSARGNGGSGSDLE